MFQYRSFSHKTIGASHKKNDKPCQDAAIHYSDENMAIAIIADGHGSPQYFRSDIGSRIATEVALNGIKEFIENNPEKPEIFVDKDRDYSNRNGQKLFARLISNIISTWFEGISADEQAFPLAQDERLDTIEEKYRLKYLNDDNHQYFSHAYGTTVIAVAITEHYWFGFHIGDGRCEVLFANGEWEQPIPWDDRCFLNSTTSICDDDAFQRARVWYGPTEKDSRLPVALFVNSDGIDDSYSVDEDIKQKQLANLYRSVVLTFTKEGFERTNAQLPTLIERFASGASQDDVSMAGIIHINIPQEFSDYLVRQDEAEKANDQVIEDRKKAEVKMQALQAAQAKAEQAAKKKDEALKTAQAAERELGQKNTVLSHQQESLLRTKRAITAAEQEKQRVETDYAKALDDLRQIDNEYTEILSSVSIAESECISAENQALHQEEQARALGDSQLFVDFAKFGRRVENAFRDYSNMVKDTLNNVKGEVNRIYNDRNDPNS